jgi:hypothetical protein
MIQSEKLHKMVMIPSTTQAVRSGGKILHDRPVRIIVATIGRREQIVAKVVLRLGWLDPTDG